MTGNWLMLGFAALMVIVLFGIVAYGIYLVSHERGREEGFSKGYALGKQMGAIRSDVEHLKSLHWIQRIARQEMSRHDSFSRN